MTIYCTQQLGFSITQAGLIMGFFGLGVITGAFVGGRITDRLGFYPLQVCALLTGGLMFIAIGYLQTFALLAVGTFILSVCNESFRPANATAIAYYSKSENRTRSYSLNRLAINLGWAVGGALGGFLASVNYHLLFWVDGCTNIVAALLLLKLLPYIKTGTKHTKQQVATIKHSAYRDKVYVAFIVLTILFATCFFQLFTILPVFYKTQWLLDEQYIGLLMALNGLIIVFFEMILVYSLEGKKPLTSFIRVGVLLVGIGYALHSILPASGWAAAICITVMTLGEILSMPFMNSFWVSRTTDTNRGQYAGMYTIAWGIAQIAAPTLGSQVAHQQGYGALCWALAFICLISSVGFTILGKRIHSLKS